MNEVFEKTRALGDAILRSEEYANVKQAESVAMKNEEAAKLMGQFMECRSQVEKMMAENDKDWAKIKQLSDDMEKYREHMNMIDDILRLTNAQEKFSQLINQVNSVLRFIVTGQMQDADETGCTGSCATCGGCHDIN